MLGLGVCLHLNSEVKLLPKDLGRLTRNCRRNGEQMAGKQLVHNTVFGSCRERRKEATSKTVLAGFVTSMNHKPTLQVLYGAEQNHKACESCGANQCRVVCWNWTLSFALAGRHHHSTTMSFDETAWRVAPLGGIACDRDAKKVQAALSKSHRACWVVVRPEEQGRCRVCGRLSCLDIKECRSFQSGYRSTKHPTLVRGG